MGGDISNLCSESAKIHINYKKREKIKIEIEIEKIEEDVFEVSDNTQNPRNETGTGSIDVSNDKNKNQNNKSLETLPENTNILSILKKIISSKQDQVFNPPTHIFMFGCFGVMMFSFVNRISQGINQMDLSRVASYLKNHGKEDEALMLKKLSKDKFFDKADLNKDGTLTEDEIDHLAGFDGDSSNLSPEDLKRLKKDDDHVLDGIDNLFKPGKRNNPPGNGFYIIPKPDYIDCDPGFYISSNPKDIDCDPGFYVLPDPEPLPYKAV